MNESSYKSFAEKVKLEISGGKVKNLISEYFLKCGKVTNPAKSYRLEFTIKSSNDFNILKNELISCEFIPKTSTRNAYQILYFSSNEIICDILNYMGASECSMEYLEAFVQKDFRNLANRRRNCDEGNIDKLSNAISHQISAIHKIQEKIGLDNLPPKLKEMAILRLENPDLPLKDLGEICGNKENSSKKPLSRSGVNNRIKKLMEISENL
jgi:DNA-binding protein WhiA